MEYNFFKSIPWNMRYKLYETVEDDNLYWVTQNFFDKYDIEQFAEEFKKLDFEKAYITVRDLSTYDFDTDMKNKVLVIIDKDNIYSEDYLNKII